MKVAFNELTISVHSSEVEIELRLLLSSRAKTKDRTVVELFIRDDERWFFDNRPRKDDWSDCRKAKISILNTHYTIRNFHIYYMMLYYDM